MLLRLQAPSAGKPANNANRVLHLYPDKRQIIALKFVVRCSVPSSSVDNSPRISEPKRRSRRHGWSPESTQVLQRSNSANEPPGHAADPRLADSTQHLETEPVPCQSS